MCLQANPHVIPNDAQLLHDMKVLCTFRSGSMSVGILQVTLPAFTLSKSAMETPERCLKSVPS